MIKQKAVEVLDSSLEDKKETSQKIFLPVLLLHCWKKKTLWASQTLRSKQNTFKIYIFKHRAA